LSTEPTLLRLGDRGERVRDLQARLTQCGCPVTLDGDFGEETGRAVRDFQTRRGLRVDGICGPDTWGALIESAWSLGDRLLYMHAPMLRGDDVNELQRRLNALGFDAGRQDGILGPETEHALRQFQRERGIEPDGVCGPATINALMSVGTLAAGSVAVVRERETLRRDARGLRGRRLFLVVDPGLAALGAATRRRLVEEGATVAIDSSGDEHSVLAAQANAFAADVCIALVSGTDLGARCAYFANPTFASVAGACVAGGITDQLRTVLPAVDEPVGRTFRLLRDTRMAAVVCDLFSREEPGGAATLAARVPEVARALARGIRQGIEQPVEGAGTRSPGALTSRAGGPR
jgi:N-acetylmuramoyl-L-alanine amidase